MEEMILPVLLWRKDEMTAVGFEPTPLRTGALSQRLRPLGQTVLASVRLPHAQWASPGALYDILVA